MTTLIIYHDMWSDSMTNKLNVLPAIFEKYPKTLHFYTFYSNTHMNWLKPCHLSILTSLVTTSGVFLWEKVECLPAICKKHFKILFFWQKVKLQLIKTLSCDYFNNSSWYVECLCDNKLNVLPAIFEKYHKQYFYTFAIIQKWINLIPVI